jgi:hypothetical protein
LSNEEKTNDYENFEKGMIYMKILKKRGGSREKGEEETKSMPHAPVIRTRYDEGTESAEVATNVELSFLTKSQKLTSA